MTSKHLTPHAQSVHNARMTFTAWCDARQRGILRRLSEQTGLSYRAVLRIYAGHPASPKSARALADATSGEVSFDTLRAGSHGC